MSPQQQTPGANAETAAARDGEAGSPATPPTPDANAPTPAAAPTGQSGTASTADPAPGNEQNPISEADPASEPSPTSEAAPTSGAAPVSAATPTAVSSGTSDVPSGADAEQNTGSDGETASSGETATPAAGDAQGAGTPQAAVAAAPTAPSRDAVAVAEAVGTTPPGTRTGTGVDRGRPRKPVLAGAAIAGAALIAIPLMLAGVGRDDGPPDTAKGLAAEGSDTVLNQTSAPAALDDYVAKTPSSSPSEKKPKKAEPPKAVAVEPAPPAPRPSRTTEKPEPKPKAKPKATPKPNWSTETVFAPSVLEVNQAWTTNRIRMVMQTDGNLVVYNEHGKPIWASMTFGQNHRAIFQSDGNLVIHNGEDRPIWGAGSYGHEGARLVLRADAKVVVVHNGTVVWST